MDKLVIKKLLTFILISTFLLQSTNVYGRNLSYSRSTITQKELISLMTKTSTIIVKMLEPTTRSSGKYALSNYIPLDKEFNTKEKIAKGMRLYVTKEYLRYYLNQIRPRIINRELCIPNGDLGDRADYNAVKVLTKKIINSKLYITYSVPYIDGLSTEKIVLSLEGGKWKLYSWSSLI